MRLWIVIILLGILGCSDRQEPFHLEAPFDPDIGRYKWEPISTEPNNIEGSEQAAYVWRDANSVLRFSVGPPISEYAGEIVTGGEYCRVAEGFDGRTISTNEGCEALVRR